MRNLKDAQVCKVLKDNTNKKVMIAESKTNREKYFLIKYAQKEDFSCARNHKIISSINPKSLIYNFSETQAGFYYICTEYCHDSNLLEKLQNSDLEFFKRVDYCIKAAECIIYLHCSGFCHGNLTLTKFIIRNDSSLALAGFEKSKFLFNQKQKLNRIEDCFNFMMRNPENFRKIKEIDHDIKSYSFILFQIITSNYNTIPSEGFQDKIIIEFKDKVPEEFDYLCNLVINLSMPSEDSPHLIEIYQTLISIHDHHKKSIVIHSIQNVPEPNDLPDSIKFPHIPSINNPVPEPNYLPDSINFPHSPSINNPSPLTTGSTIDYYSRITLESTLTANLSTFTNSGTLFSTQEKRQILDNPPISFYNQTPIVRTRSNSSFGSNIPTLSYEQRNESRISNSVSNQSNYSNVRNSVLSNETNYEYSEINQSSEVVSSRRSLDSNYERITEVQNPDVKEIIVVQSPDVKRNLNRNCSNGQRHNLSTDFYPHSGIRIIQHKPNLGQLIKICECEYTVSEWDFNKKFEKLKPFNKEKLRIICENCNEYLNFEDILENEIFKGMYKISACLQKSAKTASKCILCHTKNSSYRLDDHLKCRIISCGVCNKSFGSFCLKEKNLIHKSCSVLKLVKEGYDYNLF